MKRSQRGELPATPEAWIEEIRAAYADARDAIPFGPAAGQPFGEQELFHLAPAVALKFRKLPSRGATLRRATEAALSSYVANLEGQCAALSDPRLAFAFCYLASHYGLGLVDMATVESVMEFLEQDPRARLAVSSVGDRRIESQPALRSVHDRTVGWGLAAQRHARSEGCHRLQSQYADKPRGRNRSGGVPHGAGTGSDDDSGNRVAGPDGGLRSMSRPQIRPPDLLISRSKSDISRKTK